MQFTIYMFFISITVILANYYDHSSSSGYHQYLNNNGYASYHRYENGYDSHYSRSSGSSSSSLSSSSSSEEEENIFPSIIPSTETTEIPAACAACTCAAINALSSGPNLDILEIVTPDCVYTYTITCTTVESTNLQAMKTGLTFPPALLNNPTTFTCNVAAGNVYTYDEVLTNNHVAIDGVSCYP